MNIAAINVGPANLAGTGAMKALAEAYKGLTFQWVENMDKEGGRFLRAAHYLARLRTAAVGKYSINA